MTLPQMTLAQKIGTFAVGFTARDLSPEESHAARRALLDTLACAMGGSHEAAFQRALRYGRKVSGPGVARVWGSEERLGLEQAAFVNAVLGHVLDFDDVTSALRGHPSVAMLPALLALAEAEGLGLEAVCTAYAVGFEVAGRIGECLGDEHYAKGFHATASIGVFGATAACANLLKLTAEQTANAIGLTVAQAAGSRENFGTDAKSFQAGHSNRAALQSVLLAREGFDSSPDSLEGPCGYAKLYGAGEDLVAGMAKLGQAPRLLVQAGLDVKKYPMCYATHRALDALLDLRAATGVALADVESVAVEGSNRSFQPLLHDAPKTGLEGKFSMQYAMAAGLADGKVELASFADEAVQRPEIQAFLPKVTKRELPGSMKPRFTSITLALKDGRTLHRRVDALRGGPELPLSDAELTAKLAGCLAHAGSAADAAGVARAILAPGDRPVAGLLAMLAPVRLAAE